MPISEILKASFIVSIAAFIVAMILYGNPWIDKVYRKANKTGVLKTWKSQGKMFLLHYLIILLEVVLFSYIFSLITIHPATAWLEAGIYFGIFHFLIRILPRFLDIYMMINYPFKLLLIELVNGMLIGFVMGVGISFFLY